MTGKIIKGIAGFYVVESGGHTYMCKARGIFRKDGRKPLVGDLVRFSEAETADSEANIEELLPRTSELIRPAVCNVDQTLVVLAVRTPDPQFLLLDEYLVTMERQNVPAAILFNKADLDRDGMLDRYRRIYGAAGFQVLTSSAVTGEGIPELREFLKGKTTVLAGPSGVGSGGGGQGGEHRGTAAAGQRADPGGGVQRGPDTGGTGGPDAGSPVPSAGRISGDDGTAERSRGDPFQQGGS